MNDTKQTDDLSSLNADQIHELVEAVREDFGLDLSRADFIDSLLMLLEDVPGFESGDIPMSLLESVWTAYCDTAKSGDRA
ncbi:hypothetical protein AAFM49_11675 [Burkholderia pseudomallei]|uniref:hypothetical protein n=1 Tax=Burkholderia pseudomallei TaxID=28450 RepID=UPI00313EC284